MAIISGKRADPDSASRYSERSSELDEFDQEWEVSDTRQHREEGKVARQHVKLLGWLATKLPDDWRSDLEELRCEWITQKQPRWVVRLKTAKCLLQMLLATVGIRWINFTFKHRERITQTFTTPSSSGKVKARTAEEELEEADQWIVFGEHQDI